MANIRKPSIKSEWRGQKGNKFRVYVVVNHNGVRFVRMDKQTAMRQYEASMRVYKRLKQK